MKNGIPAQLELGLALKNPGDLELVRYLSMPITSFESQHHWAMANLNNIPALRGLSLSGLVHSRTPYPQYTLKFGFVDSDESSDTKTLLDQMLRDGVSDDDVSPLHMLAQTRMLILPQLEVACQEKFRHEFQDAFQFIPGYSEQNYLYFLWRLIIEATSKSKHFSPKGVEVAIEYMQIPSPAPVARMLWTCSLPSLGYHSGTPWTTDRIRPRTTLHDCSNNGGVDLDGSAWVLLLTCFLHVSFV